MGSGLSFSPRWILVASGISSATLLASALFLGQGSQDRDELRQQGQLDKAVALVRESGQRWLRTVDRSASWRGPVWSGLAGRELRADTPSSQLFDVYLAEVRRLSVDDLEAAWLLLMEHLPGAEPGFEQAEGQLLALQLAARRNDPEAALKHAAELRVLDGEATRQGTSYRLLGGLAAAPLLPPDQRGPAALELARQLRGGEFALPTATTLREGTQVSEDPWRAELRRRLLAACEGTPQAEDVRLQLELAAEAEAWLAIELEPSAWPRANEAWGWTRLDDETWLAKGSWSGEPPRMALLSDRQLYEQLTAELTLPLGFELQSFVADPSGEIAPPGEELLRSPVRLPDLGDQPYLEVLHRDPGSLTQGKRQQRAALRFALFALALFTAGAGWATARALRRERELSALRTRFVASVSHDLRTPLASILLTAENLEQGRIRDEGRKQTYYRAIRAEARRLARLVDDVLDFARLERGQAPSVRREPVDLAAYLQDLTDEAQERCESAGVAFEAQLSQLEQEAELDPELVTRCVSNLIENALRHSGSDQLRLWAQASPGRFELRIEDRGRGLAGEQPERLFEPYVRGAQHAEGSARGGTGLGLAIVRELARAHGGGAQLRDGQPGIQALVWFTW